MRVYGSCHCGQIAFEADIGDGDVAVCHCADCQKLSGSAYRANVGAPADGFRLLRGNPKTYLKTADSGARRAHAFCPDCGTPIYSADPVAPKIYSLRIGTLEQRHELKPPKRQIWCDSSLSWAVPAVGSQHARQP